MRQQLSTLIFVHAFILSASAVLGQLVVGVSGFGALLLLTACIAFASSIVVPGGSRHLITS